jgi:hypothetical protein
LGSWRRCCSALLGPEEVLVAAKVDFVDDTSGGAIEQACEEVE